MNRNNISINFFPLSLQSSHRWRFAHGKFDPGRFGRPQAGDPAITDCDSAKDHCR